MKQVALNTYKKDKYYPRVVRAIARILAKSDMVAPVEVLIEMGNLTKQNYDAWRNGNVPYLERVFEGSLSKANRILRIIGFHVHDLNMVPKNSTYLKRGKGKKYPLRFSKTGDRKVEEAYTRHYCWNQSQDKKQSVIKLANIDYSNLDDYEAWISLAREIEFLFGPMADEEVFQQALKQAISENRAFCIRQKVGNNISLKGGIVISKDANEIVWLAVSGKYRRTGLGRQLLDFAIGKLNLKDTIFVQTFDKSIPEGLAARRLYLDKGFIDLKDGGLNPAGIPTVIMKLTV